MNPSLPTVEPPVSRPVESLYRLAELRRRRRRIRGLDGFFRFFCVLVLIAWGTFLLDWSLELPRAIRVLHLLATVGLLFVVIRIFFLSPRRRLSQEQLAAQVEEADGSLGQALITAVQLTSPENPRAALYSSALLARTVRQAEQRITGIEPDALLSHRGLLTSVMTVTVFFVPLFFGAVLRPELAGTYVRRNLLFSDAPWPRQYDLRIIEPQTHRSLVAMGDSLSVLVQRVRGGDARIWLDSTFVGGQRERYPLERKGIDQARRQFHNIDGDFSFTVSAGDFTSRVYRVNVRNRPRIEEIALAFDYPDYTRLEDVEEPETGLGGHLKVPVGTVVHYRARTSLPVRAAYIQRAFRKSTEDERIEEALEVTDGRLLQGMFTAERSGTYQFKLVSEDDFENTNPIRYRVAVVPDRHPSIQITKPGKNSEVGGRARTRIALEADDDYGLQGVALVFREVGEEAEAAAEVRIAVAGMGTGSETEAGEFVLDLDSWIADHGGWQPTEGSRIEYYAEAVDAIEQRGTSRVYWMAIVSEEDLERVLQDEIGLIGERLRESLDSQRETRRDLERILGETQLAAGNVPEAEMPNLRHSRLSQEKINVHLEESLEHFQEIIDRITENRLTGVKELPWIQGLQKELEKITESVAPAALESVDELTRKTGAGKASTEDVQRSVDRQKENERALARLLQKLTEWGDIRTVIRQLEELKRTQEQLELKVEEKVKSTLKEKEQR